jgi:Cu+-exporting ATPase
VSEASMSETPEIDPVCKMKVLPSRAATQYEWNGKMYYFCNPGCKTKFEKAPQNYLAMSDSEAESQADQAIAVQIARGPNALDSVQSSSSEAITDLRSFYLPESAFEYTCPMDPEVRQSKPGSCPKCGMPLEAAIKSNNEEEASQEYISLRNRLIPAAILTGILLLISMPAMFGLNWLAMSTDQMPAVQLVLATPVVLWSAVPIFTKAIDSAKAGHMNMFTLIAFGVSISFVVSLVSMLFMQQGSTPEAHGAMSHDMLYFESAASIVTLVLFGQLLELKARESSNKSMQDLFRMAPAKARKELDNKATEVPIYEVKPGDRLRILPGDQIPVDGKIIEGSSSVDESLLTGNALPTSKSSGQNVYAGTINGDGSILVLAEALGRQTVFAQIANLLSSAQKSRSRMQDLADRVSAVFIPSVLFISILTFAGWYFLAGTGAISHAIQNAIAVLIIACPCALGLATPLAVSQAVARAARFGLMVKDARALENLAVANYLFIDKTGTLTRGVFELVAIRVRDGVEQNGILQRLAALEKGSTHPLAHAVVEAAKKQGLPDLIASDLKSLPGLGLKARVEGIELIAGNASFMQSEGVNIEAIKVPNDDANFKGSTRIYVASKGDLQAVLALKDQLKPEGREFVSLLRKLDVSPKVLTGDADWSVGGTAEELQIPAADIHCNLLPQDKVELIKKEQSKKNVVAMLGDGVNDAAALSSADAGIAMSNGSDVAVHSAAITINGTDLRLTLSGIKLGRLMLSTIKQNLVLAFGYNAIALIFATGLLYKATGIELTPTIAAAAMSLSSISVILNSMRIRNADF